MTRIPRALHPLAWWIWAAGLAIAASRTTNPLLLLLILAVLAFVVASRRSEAPWARAFKYYLYLGLSVIILRIVFRTIFSTGVAPSDHILFRLPHIPTPHWYSGISIGGPVSLEATLSAATDGLRLATMLCCIGAANVLANPKRALRVLPGALYELGMAVVVAVTVAPQLIESAQRVLRARRLRPAARKRGPRALRAVAIPVLEDAFERSLRLAAAMDSRGYGRVGTASARGRRVSAVLLIGGLLGLCGGTYALLDGTTSTLIGWPILLAGAALCAGGLALGSRRVRRTRYRPDPWRAPEWIVAGCGVVTCVLMCVTVGYRGADLNPDFSPLRFPALPAVPALAILLAALAGFVAPPPPRPARSAPSGPAPAKQLVATS